MEGKENSKDIQTPTQIKHDTLKLEDNSGDEGYQSPKVNFL